MFSLPKKATGAQQVRRVAGAGKPSTGLSTDTEKGFALIKRKGINVPKRGAPKKENVGYPARPPMACLSP